MRSRKEWICEAACGPLEIAAGALFLVAGVVVNDPAEAVVRWLISARRGGQFGVDALAFEQLEDDPVGGQGQRTDCEQQIAADVDVRTLAADQPVEPDLADRVDDDL
jgi:hypothetical protein